MTALNLKDTVGTIEGIKRQGCEVWSRVVGYLRPEGGWNKGKRAEFKDRTTYDYNKATKDD